MYKQQRNSIYEQLSVHRALSLSSAKGSTQSAAKQDNAVTAVLLSNNSITYKYNGVWEPP